MRSKLWKCIKKHNVVGFSIRLNEKRTTFREDGEYSLVIKGTLRGREQQKTVRCETRQAALDLFAIACERPDEVLKPSDLSPEAYAEDAERVVEKGLPAQEPTLSLPLLLSLVAHQVRRSKAQLAYVSVVAQVLESKAVPPSPHDSLAWRSWLRECTKELQTRILDRSKSSVVAADSAMHRLRIFKRALRCLVAYADLLPSGRLFAGAAAQAAVVIDEAARVSRDAVRSRQSFEPLTRGQIEAVIRLAPTLAAKVYILKLLAFGGRPQEALKSRYEHLRGDTFDLKAVVTKTEKSVSKLAPPPSSLAFRFLLRFEKEAGIKLVDSDRKWLKYDHPYALKQYRTTCAVHLLYATAGNIEVVRGRLGHASLDMTIKHYNRISVPDAGTRSPVTYYELPSELRVESKDVFTAEKNNWDKYVLLLALRTIRADREDLVEPARRWLLGELPGADVLALPVSRVESF